MIIETRQYQDFIVSSVQFDPGEQHYSPPATQDTPCLGVLFLSGSWKLHSSGTESGPDDLGWHTPKPDGTWPQAFWNSYTANDYCEAGPSGVAWICLEGRSRAQSWDLSHIALGGSDTVPPGYRLIVADGSITIGDPSLPAEAVPTREVVKDNLTFRLFAMPAELASGTGTTLDCFSASDSDRTMSGSGQAILIKMV